MTKIGECPEVASWSATKVQYRERRRSLNVLKQRTDILAYIMAARTPARIPGPARCNVGALRQRGPSDRAAASPLRDHNNCEAGTQETAIVIEFL